MMYHTYDNMSGKNIREVYMYELPSRDQGTILHLKLWNLDLLPATVAALANPISFVV